MIHFERKFSALQILLLVILLSTTTFSLKIVKAKPLLYEQPTHFRSLVLVFYWAGQRGTLSSLQNCQLYIRQQ